MFDYEDVESFELMHVGRSKLDGAPVGSGRYPLGSGENPNQHNSVDFLSQYKELKKAASNEVELAKMMGFSSTTKLRQANTIAHTVAAQQQIHVIRQLYDDEGLGWTEIGRRLGLPEATVRDKYKNEKSSKNATRLDRVAGILKDEIKNGKKMIDVSAGVEKEFSLDGKEISANTLQAACKQLENEGYSYFKIQVGATTDPKRKTTYTIIGEPDLNARYAYTHLDEVDSFLDYAPNPKDSNLKAKYPASLDGDRVAIRYAEEGGLAKDGVIEIRKGVEDLSLGKSSYAQVRILVDGTHYLKGMAVYSDDVPEGKDIVFNTNKSVGTDKYKVLKAIKNEDPDNPFGANIMPEGQYMYKGKDGKEHLSPINKLKEESDWDKMSKNLSSQFLSKQPVGLIKTQLNLTYADKNAEFDKIKSLTNPVLRKRMLIDFADQCETDAWQMKASPLPGQSTKVILPLTKIKDTECYCPTYTNGTKLALIRYPHAGTFEIPIVNVNNRNADSKRLLGDVQDAIGISSKTAEQLSGADFDGDQVVAIPITESTKIVSKPILSGLKGYDPKREYATEKTTKTNRNGETVDVYINTTTGKPCTIMSEKYKQKQMGAVSNLITDMTLDGGASIEDYTKAVRHSMTVIDAVKHKLDYKQSEIDNDIAYLKKKYQGRIEDGKYTESARTLLSRRKQDIEVPERKGSPMINKDTGEVTYKTSGRMRRDPKTGEYTLPATDSVKKVLYYKDSNVLSSGTKQESLYADYSNKMKALANTARKEAMSIETYKKDTEASHEYAKEVDSLKAKLSSAERNAPRERKANLVSNARVQAKAQAYEDEYGEKMDKGEYKKLKQRELTRARLEFGASGKRTRIQISDAEWDAIQHKAIAATTLDKILAKCDQDALKERALPKQTKDLSQAQIAQIKAMLASGYTYGEISKRVGVSSSTISNYS